MSFYSREIHLKTVALLLVAGALATVALGAGLPYLLELPGIATVVHYVPGGLDRSAHVQMRFELLIDDYRQWTGDKRRQSLFVLDREAWDGLEAQVPYGMPMRVADGVALAAAGDDGTVRLWMRLVGDAIPVTATGSGMALGNTPAEVGSLSLHDLLAEVEVSRLLVEQGSFRGESGWIDEVTVHVVAQAAFLRHEAGRMEEIDLLFSRLRDLKPGLLPLPKGATPRGVTMEEWLAYQGRYFAGAQVIVEKDGLGAVKKLRKLTKKGKEPLTKAALVERYPDLTTWFGESLEVWN